VGDIVVCGQRHREELYRPPLSRVEPKPLAAGTPSCQRLHDPYGLTNLRCRADLGLPTRFCFVDESQQLRDIDEIGRQRVIRGDRGRRVAVRDGGSGLVGPRLVSAPDEDVRDESMTSNDLGTQASPHPIAFRANLGLRTGA
jgi:hypothetical protein